MGAEKSKFIDDQYGGDPFVYPVRPGRKDEGTIYSSSVSRRALGVDTSISTPAKSGEVSGLVGSH